MKDGDKMLDDLRRIIESEMEYDDLNDIMMEATDNAIADMSIEEDGEAVISDAEVMGILEKIPEYDEEAAMNKKLARIAEAYIPEELVGLQESAQYDYNDEDITEEGFKEALVKLKRSFTKKGREYNKGEKYLENVRKAFDVQFKDADENQLKEMKKGLLDAIATNEPILEKEEDKVIKQMMEKQTQWMRDSIKRIDDKLNAVKESTEVDDDLTYLYEMFDLDDLIK